VQIIGEFQGVPEAEVLEVLRSWGVQVRVEGQVTYLSKGDLLIPYRFPARLKRRMLRALARQLANPGGSFLDFFKH
jgi:hypothetical protein